MKRAQHVISHGVQQPEKQKLNGFPHTYKKRIFRLINDGADARTITPSVYNEFIKEVCTVCCAPPSQRHHLIFTLAYIEKELGCLHEIHKAESSHTIPIRKALTFVRRMFRYLQTQTPPLSAQKSDIPDTPFRWTGSLVELVEIIYAFDEIGCINDGENDIKELAAFFGQIFRAGNKGQPLL